VTALGVSGLRFEHRRDGLGIGEARPRLSWVTITDVPGWRQTGYEIERRDDTGAVAATTGRVGGDESWLVPWPGPPLASRQRAEVRVRVWGTDGQGSAWSELAPVEAGLLATTDWVARFVTPGWEDDPSEQAPCPFLRREFEVAGSIRRARLYITALGVYEAEINGSPVGEHVLAPGWSSYDHRLRYETFDVTGLVRPGSNALGAILGDGWYRGRLGFRRGRRNIYGDRLALLAQLEVVTADGETQVVSTDGSWQASTGPIVSSGIYEGETYDARLEQAGPGEQAGQSAWSQPGYDGRGWKGVTLLDRDLRPLVARTGPPVRRTELVPPVEITTSPSGRTILDFGQNLVGRLRIRVSGPAGTTVTLRHAEVLQDGELCTELLRNATATDRYTLRGDGVETWEPRFTFHGFRYAEISGWPGRLDPDDVTAVVCHSDMERTGWFECSNDRVNRLHDNIVWGMRGNFVDVPTDCPQRDERLGWTGDLQVFAPTASFLYDCAGLLASWLRDLAADQGDDGVVPVVVPNIAKFLDFGFPSAGWSDAAVVVPWVLYQRFGDLGVLRDQYPSMRAWVEHIVGLAGERRLWLGGFQFGDWLDPAAPTDNPFAARTDADLVANAYLCRSLDLLANAAELLGETDDAARHRAVAEEVRAAFGQEYVAPSGRVVSDSQTAYALALQFGLLPEAAQRARAGERLAGLVEKAAYKIATGFLGTPIICDALCDAGEVSTAYRLLLQEECPSWLYPLSRGATTIWERWDGIRPDGSLNGVAMNSFNHYAYGAVGDWLHRTVGGLAPAAPGYRRILVAPKPGGGLTWATSRHRTPYGLAESSWRIVDGAIEVSVIIPPNTTASVVLPGQEDDPIEVGSGRHQWRHMLPLEGEASSLVAHPAS
jgi:alpha-L-rhamnosidase